MIQKLASGFTETVTGTKRENVYVYVNNNGGPWVEASYPYGLSGTTWSYTVTLVSGVNNIYAVTSFIHSTSGALSVEAIASIYLATLTPQAYNVWNSFDELGLLLSLQRNLGEKNESYRSRLINVYQAPGNSTYQGLLNGISRELGLTPEQISINTLADLMDPTYAGNLLNEDGNAIGTPLVGYAEEVYHSNPVFLGTVISDQSYWDGVNQNTNGYIYLPHIWDATANGIYPKWQGGGIGDHDDLWVTGPIQIWNPSINDYNWYLQVHTGYFYSSYPWSLFGTQPSSSIWISPSGFNYSEYYLYAQKNWQMAPSGVSYYVLASGVQQNAPVIITSSGLQETSATDPFGRYDGRGKYGKVGFGNFTSTNQFALNPSASGLISFSEPLTENVFIEYEAGNSSYYTLSSIDLNPMRNQFDSGFISFSANTYPTTVIVAATNTTLTSNGAQKTNILATLLDANGDGVPNQPLVFWIPSASFSYLEPIDNGVVTTVIDGYPTQVTNTTNPKGQARCSYWPINGLSGTQNVYASWQTSYNNVAGGVQVKQEYTLGNPFLLASGVLDPSGSLLNSQDYLT